MGVEGWETDLQGTGEDAFVLPLWMSLRVELNCQLMRFPNHVLLSSLGPNRFVPQTAAGGKAAFPSLRARESPEQVQELESGDPIIDIHGKPLGHSLLESA